MTAPRPHAELAARLRNIECSLLDEDENATLREAADLLDPPPDKHTIDNQHTTQRGGKRMELETINKLYLELSQITTATTAREILLQKQLAEAQRDAERLDWIIEHRAYVVSDPDCCDGYWLNYQRKDGTVWTQATEHETPRAAIDAAKGERDATN